MTTLVKDATEKETVELQALDKMIRSALPQGAHYICVCLLPDPEQVLQVRVATDIPSTETIGTLLMGAAMQALGQDHITQVEPIKDN
jgi:hypothetical protein